MVSESSFKITSEHLARTAYLYVRQSTLKQVHENTESTERQYALRKRALALGWPDAQITTIDCDLGKSGSSAAGREGFQRLVAEVGLGRAGIVMGLEVSRLARNSADWHRLLELCGLTGTLLLDEDAVYDPRQFNDRLLLGLKGTMSEAELYLIRARMRGGVLNKVKKGAMRMALPAGYVHDLEERTILDPDQQVQSTLRLVFETYRRTGSAYATLQEFRKNAWPFPRKTKAEEVIWKPATYGMIIDVLHNPCYAGAYVYGRSRTRKRPEGGYAVRTVQEREWTVCLKNAHPGYIPWEDYEANQERLRQADNWHGAGLPREGVALLQGIVLCGTCGASMSVHYYTVAQHPLIQYKCSRFDAGEAPCQSLAGARVDAAVGALVIELMSAQMLEVTLAVQAELRDRAEEADRLRRHQVERAHYEAEKAQRRYMKVDFDNRLVAGTLEKEWNDKLTALSQVQEAYERQRIEAAQQLTAEQEARIRALATEFPQVWNDPETPDREKKRLLRLLVEDVTLTKEDAVVRLDIRFKGGATRTLQVKKSLRGGSDRKTPKEVLERLRQGRETLLDGEIALQLNQENVPTGAGGPWTARKVYMTCRTNGIATYEHRLKVQGWLSGVEMGKILGITARCCFKWYHAGLLEGRVVNEHNTLLYAPLSENHPAWTRAKSLPNPPEIRSGSFT